MKCQKCGFVQNIEDEVCKLCGTSLQVPRLIKFPTQRAEPAPIDPSDRLAGTPEWKAQLREKVQAIRARKGLEAAMESAMRKERLPAAEPQDVPDQKNSNAIVEAALIRVRRAGETDPGGKNRPVVANGSVRVDRMSGYVATASATLPVLTPVEEARPPLPATDPIFRPATDQGLPVQSAPAPTTAAEVQETSSSSLSTEGLEESGARAVTALPRPGHSEPAPQLRLDALDWDSDLDWTPEELSEDRVRPLATRCADEPECGAKENEFLFSSASFRQRLMAGCADVAVVGFSCVPFVALMELNNVNLFDQRVQFIIASVATLVYFLYTFLLLAVAGRTVGMMAVNVIAVDRHTKNVLSLRQGFFRALGFLAGALPLFLGHLWPLLDREHRSLSDILSGTSVAAAFEEYPQGRLPWLYRHTG